MNLVRDLSYCVFAAVIGFGLVCLFLITFGCDLRPTGPTDPIITINNRASIDTGGSSSSEGGATPTLPSVPVTINYSSTNSDGKVIYSIGPGLSFSIQGGDASIVWCRPASDCNGSGINRSGDAVASPMADWIVRGHSFFRQAGSVGSLSIFIVDGQEIRHNFN